MSRQLARRPDVLEVGGLKELESVLDERTSDVDVVLIGPTVRPNDALKLAEKVQRNTPEVSVVFVADSLSSDLLQSALRAGVRDILPLEFTEDQLTGVLDRAEALSKQIRERASTPADEAGAAARAHELITVFSSKGGVGKSFVAANLAVMLAQRTGEEVALVDLDLQFGDLAIMLQLFPARTISDAAANLPHLDSQALRGYLVAHRTGVHLMAAPLEPGLAETVPAEAVQRILRMLRQTYRYVVVDSPAAFTEHIVAALDESEHCVLITSMDVPSIKNLKLAMQTMDLLGFGRERIKLMLNRADTEVGLKVSEVERTLGTKVDISVPSGREVPLSINRGLPLVTEAKFSPVVLALGQLADQIGAPRESAVPDGDKKGRLFRRKAG
ncbi:MAG TPA: P-loop NTPase [Actinomycetota bacterium]|nr:P-loop NTPase [Actinomycetota bacterium]